MAFGKSIGMGYIRPELVVPGTVLKVRIMDQLWDATVAKYSPDEPKNEAIRKDG